MIENGFLEKEADPTGNPNGLLRGFVSIFAY